MDVPEVTLSSHAQNNPAASPLVAAPGTAEAAMAQGEPSRSEDLSPPIVKTADLPNEILLRILKYATDFRTLQNVRISCKLFRELVSPRLFRTLVLDKTRRMAAERAFAFIDSGCIRFVKYLVICSSSLMLGAVIRPGTGSSSYHMDDLYGDAQDSVGPEDEPITQGVEPVRVDEDLIASNISFINLLGIDDVDDEDRKYDAFLLWVVEHLMKNNRKLHIYLETDQENDTILKKTRMYPRYLRLQPTTSMWIKAFLGRLCRCVNRVLAIALEKEKQQGEGWEVEVSYKIRYLKEGSRFWRECGMELLLERVEGRYDFSIRKETSTRDEQHIIFHKAADKIVDNVEAGRETSTDETKALVDGKQ